LPSSAAPTPGPLPIGSPVPRVAPVPEAPVPAPQTKPPEPPKPPIVMHVFQDWKGSESGIQESRTVVIRKELKWQQLWAEMQSKDPIPPVDFSDKIVLGILAGEKPAGTSIVLGKIEADEDLMLAPYRINLPVVQTSSGTAVAAPVIHPYLLAVIPRVEMKIRLTQKENPR